MLPKLLRYIRERHLIRAGERVGVAVSGGADSVALLRAMLELREELGVVLSVLHFNHGIRGEEANEDANFVAHLAQEHKLHLHQATGDVPLFAKKWKVGTEAAARRLRYDFFRAVLAEGSVHKIATAHTRDDQAETVLLRMLRGAGTRGIAGIHPVLKVEAGAIIRPMLEVSRAEVEAYLNALGQTWREDSTNRNTDYARNRVRHDLLPLLERDYNPNIREVLAESAEVARDEDAFWTTLIDRVAQDAVQTDKHGSTIQFSGAAAQALAIQRRLLRVAADRIGLQLDFHHSQRVLGLLRKTKNAEVELPTGWCARKLGDDRLQLARKQEDERAAYEYPATVPGEVRIEAVRTLVRLTIVRGDRSRAGYNPASLLDATRLDKPLIIRNWRHGDRMQPLHRGAEEKLKRLFQEKKIPAEDRASWPVMTSGDQIVWAKQLGVAAAFVATDAAEAILIEAENLSPGSSD